MLKIKEILLRFQEDTKFIEKVAKSNTIDKLYEVFCEYEYNSDINSFESEIYELLSNSDLVKESIDEEELEKISGGANMRKKIMSVIALSSLAMGEIAPITHVDAGVVLPGQKNKKVTRVDAGNVAAKPQSRKCGDTFLPVKEWETIGIGLLTTILGLGGGSYIYYRHKKSKSTAQTQRPTGTTEFQENRDQTADFDSLVFEGGDRNDETYNFDGEKGFEKALECIEEWYTTVGRGANAYSDNVVDAVKKVERTLFPKERPKSRSMLLTQISLKLFPKTVENCTQKTDKYFVPLSWNDGKGNFNAEDDFMLHKVLFQYLSRMLCFVLKNDKISGGDNGYGYVDYLSGRMPFDHRRTAPDYSNLFNCMVDHHEVYEEYSNVKSQVTALIKTLDSMYSHAKSMCSELAKCGVFCGENPRRIDN